MRRLEPRLVLVHQAAGAVCAATDVVSTGIMQRLTTSDTDTTFQKINQATMPAACPGSSTSNSRIHFSIKKDRGR